MDERTLAATVADQANLAKEEAADLIRATLDELGRQLSSGEVGELARDLPDDLAVHLPRHDGRAHPIPLAEFVRRLSQRTGLKESEVTAGVRAVLTALDQMPGTTHLQHALSQLPADYRRLSLPLPQAGTP
jgi:uncharacterized protein (DUF2267 family)